MVPKFQSASREKVWAKILLVAPSGGGKSYSALRLATGISQKMGKPIAAIDTENGRIRYYADEFTFDDITLEAPYTPEKYIEAIDAAVDGGYGVLIIDSTSHEWEYLLDVHNKMPGNSYTNWGKINPRHDAFKEAILQSKIHIIATARGKDEYVLEEKNGKQTPKKVGIGYKQRDGAEYEYSASFNIDQDTHVASATKDNTHIFEGRYDILTEKDGEAVYKWANTGKEAESKPKAKPAPKPDVNGADANPDNGEAADIIKQIDALAKELPAIGVDKSKVMNAIKSNFVIDGKPIANYNKIADVETAQNVLAALQALKGGAEDRNSSTNNAE